MGKTSSFRGKTLKNRIFLGYGFHPFASLLKQNDSERGSGMEIIESTMFTPEREKSLLILY